MSYMVNAVPVKATANIAGCPSQRTQCPPSEIPRRRPAAIRFRALLTIRSVACRRRALRAVVPPPRVAPGTRRDWRGSDRPAGNGSRAQRALELLRAVAGDAPATEGDPLGRGPAVRPARTGALRPRTAD